MELTKENLQSLRQEYRSAELSENDIDSNPIQQFKKWFTEAVDAQLYEPNVMTLATATAEGRPSARILLLKGFDENGFVFFTNYESEKGKELTANPYASMVFFWPELERQVCIEGKVSKISAEESSAYFHSRPAGSQIGANASVQSSKISSREVLESKVELLTEKYKGQEIPRPDYWGGYLLTPTSIEFWQGRPSRLHDRMLYEFTNGTWIINRLAP